MTRYVLLAAAILAVPMLCGDASAELFGFLNPGFTNPDIEAMKDIIKQEFEKREGVKVIEVEMIKESSTKAIGFVKLQVPLFGQITKSCSATMGESGRYIWECR